MKSLLSLIPLAALILSGCATTHNFQVDAINNPSMAAVTGRSFVIVPGNPDIKPNDLRYIEAIQYAEAALATAGYYRSPTEQDADIIIALDAGVGEPQQINRRVSQPVYAEVGGYHRSVVRPVRGKDGQTHYIRTTIWEPPVSRYVGSVDSQETYIVYPKRLALTAFQRGTGNQEDLPQLWSVVVMNTNGSSDLRAYLPMMAAAAAQYIGKNTGKQITIKFDPEDPTVQLMREGI